MEAIDVFRGINGFEDALGIDLRRQRKLNQDAVHVVVAIQVFDDGEHFEHVDSGWRRDKRAGEAELFAGGDFAFHVELRGGIFADEDSCETGTNACRSKQTHFVF